ncbi:MAG: hypothetical protein Q4G04_05300 [bacterium]|nr:hypothetical protein [bacterium]
MKYDRYDEIKFDDRTYIVVESIELDGKTYVYLVLDSDDKEEYALVHAYQEGDKTYYQNVMDENLFSQLMSMIVEKNQDFIQNLLEEK